MSEYLGLLFIPWMIFYLCDEFYFRKRRHDKIRADMIEGIIAGLKEHDTTLVIDERVSPTSVLSKSTGMNQ